jgi:hypothetical protein
MGDTVEVLQSRERASFVAWWEAYKLVLESCAARGLTAVEAAEYAHQAATAAEIDYREKVRQMNERCEKIGKSGRASPLPPPPGPRTYPGVGSSSGLGALIPSKVKTVGPIAGQGPETPMPFPLTKPKSK